MLTGSSNNQFWNYESGIYELLDQLEQVVVPILFVYSYIGFSSETILLAKKNENSEFIVQNS